MSDALLKGSRSQEMSQCASVKCRQEIAGTGSHPHAECGAVGVADERFSTSPIIAAQQAERSCLIIAEKPLQAGVSCNGVADPDVHSVAADRAHDVGSVSTEQCSTVEKTIAEQALGNEGAPGRYPICILGSEI